MTQREIVEDMVQSGGSTTVPASTSKVGGILDTLREQLSPTTFVEKFKASKSYLMEIALYGGIGFISGFLLKKYSSFIVAVVLFTIGIALLQHFGVVNILVNWDKVHEFFGIQMVSAMNAHNAAAMAWAWIKANSIISISYAVGFLIGFSVA
jgi:uncharacterized membrane protein (Fun14 family)